MPNPTFPSSSLSHGKASPQFSYIYDSAVAEWRPITPGDFVGLGGNSFNLEPPVASNYLNVNLSGQPVEVTSSGTKLVGFLVDNNLNDEPLFIQFYSNPYNTGSIPVLTYPIYAQSTVDQNFTYSIGGFEGIVTKISTDKEGKFVWMGNSGNGVLANIYYRV